MRCYGTISDYFLFIARVGQECVPAPTLFITCMDNVLTKMSEMSGCGVSFRAVRFINLNFADDSVIFVETTEIFAEELDSLSEETGPFEL